MNIDKTLFVSDLDGTLLNDDQKLSEQTRRELATARAKGLNFTYATARSIFSSRFVLEALNLTLPVILYNGAQIYCPKQKYIHSAYMEPSSYLEQLKTLLAAGLAPVVHSLDENDNLRVYFQQVTNESTAMWLNSRLKNGDTRFRVTTDFSEIDPTKVVELMVVASQDRLTPIAHNLNQAPSISYVLSEDIYCPGHYWLEMTHLNANKGYAVKVLADYLKLESIVCFGDNHNDIPMFEQSNRSLAVGNAKGEVKQAADEIIGSNNDDGVAAFIKQVFSSH